MHRAIRSFAATTLALALMTVAPAAESQSSTSVAEQVDSPGLPVELAHASRYQLENGLDVVTLEDHRTPRIAVLTTYRVGGRDQPAGYHGVAHLLEHSMYEGSRHAPGHEYSTRLDIAGATDINAATSQDLTEYRVVVPAHQLALALWLESDRMAFLLDSLDDRTVSSQLGVVLNEHRERMPSAIVEQHLDAILGALYPADHPYRSLPDSVADYSSITLGAVQWFFQRYYNPNDATIVLVGDFDTLEARELIERYFGPIVNASGPHATPAVSLPNPPRQRQLVTYARSRLESVAFLWTTPPPFTAEAAHLDLAATVLSRRLSRRLIFQDALAGDVSVSHSARQLGSTFSIDVDVARDVQPDRVIVVVDEELQRFFASGATEEELSRARNSRLRSLMVRTDDLLSHATLLRDSVLVTGQTSFLGPEFRLRRDASNADLVATTRRLLGNRRRVTSIVRSTSSVRSDLLVQRAVLDPMASALCDPRRSIVPVPVWLP